MMRREKCYCLCSQKHNKIGDAFSALLGNKCTAHLINYAYRSAVVRRAQAGNHDCSKACVVHSGQQTRTQTLQRIRLLFTSYVMKSTAGIFQIENYLVSILRGEY